MGRSGFILSRMARSWKPTKGLSLKSTYSPASIVPIRRPQAEEEKSKDKTGDAGKRLEEALARATIPIEDRFASGDNKMWDLEFSSMSSYASHDLKISTLDVPGFDCCDLNAAASGRTDASCSEIEEDEEQQEQGQSGDYEEHGGGRAAVGKTFAKTTSRHQRGRNYSLSAALPVDLKGPAGDSIPLVMDSIDPYGDFRSSMEEMVHENGIFEWQELQELLYCYIALNSPDQHESIKQAFLDVVLELHPDDDLDFLFE